MNRQISYLTSPVIALTEKISFSNRKGNGLLTASSAYETLSDNNFDAKLNKQSLLTLVEHFCGRIAQWSPMTQLCKEATHLFG